MGLKGAMTDRGRLKTSVSTGVKVRGQTQYIPEDGPWFQCRVSQNTSNEVEGRDTRFVQFTSEFLVIVAPTDENGDTMALAAKDMMEIEDGPFAGTYEVDGKPIVVTKKSRDRVVLIQAGLKRYDGKDGL